MIETPGRILDRHLTEPLEQSNLTTSANGRGLIRRALNIPQPSLCLDVACEDVGVGLWSRDVLAMTRL